MTMRSELFNGENMAQQATQLGITLQHKRCVKAAINGELLASQGAMIGYRGNVSFEVKSQGVGKFLKRAFTGEGLALMSVRGHGEIWFASLAHECFLIDLEPGDALSINGRNVICFDPTLHYDIQMVRGAGMLGGGLFNSVFTGHGRLAIASDGQPIVVPVTPQAPVYADTDAVIGWSSGLQSTIHKSQSLSSLLRGGSGELFQIVFAGDGFVLLQPSEGIKVQTGGSGGAGLFSG
jgi:uncharacterized protein (AIM24 family)